MLFRSFQYNQAKQYVTKIDRVEKLIEKKLRVLTGVLILFLEVGQIIQIGKMSHTEQRVFYTTKKNV